MEWFILNDQLGGGVFEVLFKRDLLEHSTYQAQIDELLELELGVLITGS